VRLCLSFGGQQRNQFPVVVCFVVVVFFKGPEKLLLQLSPSVVL
jgi:hypothetical protein